jgi:hypothetical protein
MQMRLSRTSLLAICYFLTVALRAEDAPKALPPTLQVPNGHVVLFKVEAKGVQIYKSAMGANPKWVFEAPLANLYDTDGKHVGRHYEGPTWESIDGSKVKKPADEKPVSADAPNAKSDIPWLLIALKSDGDKAGVLSKAQYVQRIETKGGIMPVTPPTKAGERAFVEYTAIYVFYN